MAFTTQQAPARAAGRFRALSTPRAAGLVGVAAAISSATLSWNPSFWGDEAASIMSAQRSIPSLFEMVQRVDAVHAAYYLFLHFWIRLVGISEFAVRFPSAVAVGLAAAGTFLLASWFASTRVAIITGIACAVLPRFTYMGMEARSSAMATAIAVWLTVLLVVLLRSHNQRWQYWAGYAVLAAIGTWLFLYLALLVVAHGVWVLLDRQSRPRLRAWAAAAGGAAVLSLPLAILAVAERNQIAFLSQRPIDANALLVTPWFGNIMLAVLGWCLVLLAAVVAFRRGTRRQSRLTLLALLWLLLPAAILLAVTLSVIPIYTVRYLSISSPAAALLIALGIDALGNRYLRWVAVALVVATATPTWIYQRGEFAKDGGSDWRQVAEYIGAHAAPGDGVYFDTNTKPSQRPRLGLHLYPTSYAGLVDVALRTPFDKGNWLWDDVYSLEQVGPALAPVSTLWVIDLTGSTPQHPSDQQNALRSEGFGLVNTETLYRTTVYEYTR